MLLIKRVDVVISKERVARHVLNTFFSKDEVLEFVSLPEQVNPVSKARYWSGSHRTSTGPGNRNCQLGDKLQLETLQQCVIPLLL